MVWSQNSRMVLWIFSYEVNLIKWTIGFHKELSTKQDDYIYLSKDEFQDKGSVVCQSFIIRVKLGMSKFLATGLDLASFFLLLTGNISIYRNWVQKNWHNDPAKVLWEAIKGSPGGEKCLPRPKEHCQVPLLLSHLTPSSSCFLRFLLTFNNSEH